MKLGHIAVATDGSEAARGAYLVARDLAGRAGARVTVVRVMPGRRIPVGAYRDRSSEERAGLEAWVDSLGGGASPAVEVEFGHPSVEIPRFAETRGADLLVLGRTPRTQGARIRAGDTADAVVRRSLVPCLLVPPGAGPPHRLLAAADGTPRGDLVMRRARELAGLLAMDFRVVTVEPPAVEGGTILRSGARRLQAQLGQRVKVRHGPIYEEVLAEIRDTGADLLAIGVRRGGPPGVLELASIGRHLAHGAPCAVLTIPL